MTRSAPLPAHASGSRRRLALRSSDVEAVQHASVLIAELGSALDAALTDERRPGERMRMLRETTNRITRTANDAVQAYRRVSQAVQAETARPDGDPAAAAGLRRRLDAARDDLLKALDAARQRYPWTDGDASAPDGSDPPNADAALE
jgi:hypothetical protein